MINIRDDYTPITTEELPMHQADLAQRIFGRPFSLVEDAEALLRALPDETPDGMEISPQAAERYTEKGGSLIKYASIVLFEVTEGAVREHAQ